LVRAQGRYSAATVRLPRHLAALQRPVKKDGPNVDIETYSFLTTIPNPLVATINHERMPVLLTREEEFQAWLSGSPDDAMDLAREYPPEQMHIVQAGLDKEDLLGAPSPLGQKLS
jgi:putative SOS response-associated peptidase YedK